MDAATGPLSHGRHGQVRGARRVRVAGRGDDGRAHDRQSRRRPMTFAIREATEADEDLATIVRVVNETTPDDPDSIENVRWSNATYPGTSRFIADEDGAPIGVGTVGRIYMHPPDFE